MLSGCTAGALRWEFDVPSPSVAITDLWLNKCLTITDRRYYKILPAVQAVGCLGVYKVFVILVRIRIRVHVLHKIQAHI